MNPNLMLWPMSTTPVEATGKSFCIIPTMKITQDLPVENSSTLLPLGGIYSHASSHDLNSLKMLIAQGHLKSAFNLTTRLLLHMSNPQHTSTDGSSLRSGDPLSLFDLWACRFQLFLALRLYDELLEELTPFGELSSPDTYFDFYPEYQALGYTGSVIPFSLRMVHAEAPAFSKEPWASFGRIARLEEGLELIRQQSYQNFPQSDQEIWRKRGRAVELIKGRLLYRLKDFNSLFLHYEKIYLRSSAEAVEGVQTSALSMLVRLAIAAGDEKRMKAYLERLRNMGDTPTTDHEYQKLCSVFASFFYGEFNAAYSELDKAHKLVDKELSLTSINNEAIALLYLGRAEEALTVLFNHKGATVEPVAINLSAIADLAATSDGNELKRNYLLRHLDKIPDSFIIPPSMRANNPYTRAS